MSTFRFKQFQIQQDLSAAKVGTDGVLLGSWVTLDQEPSAILDIGSGTGLISLMLAQRFPSSNILAIEKNQNAYQETCINFKNSPWSKRLTAKHLDFLRFNTFEKFDLVVSNPPFYKEEVFSKNVARDMARNLAYLPFVDLITKSKRLLTKKGVLAVIIPYKDEIEFIRLAKSHELYPSNICRVQGNHQSTIKRSLIKLSAEFKETNISHITIETDRHVYTEAYINLTRDFYLNM